MLRGGNEILLVEQNAKRHSSKAKTKLLELRLGP